MRGKSKAWRLAGLAVLLIAMGSGCSPAQIVNSFVSHRSFRLVTDQPYGAEPRQKLDVYVPAAGGGGPKPVVLFFYGGNWQRGDKADYLFVGEALASRGFIAVIPDYRLYPAVRYPAFLHDCAASVAWTLDHVGALGGDLRRVYLMGHSAGAYNAVMLALDPRWLGEKRDRIAGTIGLAGPYDFLPLKDPILQIVFGTAPDLETTQPIRFADSAASPILLISGLSDDTVRPRNSQRLAARIRARGGKVEERYYKGVGHVALVAAIAAPLRSLAPVLDDATAFLRAGK